MRNLSRGDACSGAAYRQIVFAQNFSAFQIAQSDEALPADATNVLLNGENAFAAPAPKPFRLPDQSNVLDELRRIGTG